MSLINCVRLQLFNFQLHDGSVFLCISKHLAVQYISTHHRSDMKLELLLLLVQCFTSSL